MDDSARVEMLTAAGPVGSAVAERVAKADILCAPHLIDTEVMSALLGMARGGKITSDQADAAMIAYERLPIDRYDSLPLWPRIKVLRANLSAYDSTYVALAEALGATLVTSDARIGRSGAARCPLEIFEDVTHGEGIPRSPSGEDRVTGVPPWPVRCRPLQRVGRE